MPARSVESAPRSIKHALRAALTVFALLIGVSQAKAQTAVNTLRGPSPIRVSVIAGMGRAWQSATNSFDAVLGTSSGNVPGGGVEVTWRDRVFVRGEFDWFSADGQRVDVVNGEVVPLGIPMTITMIPIEVTGGYRFGAHRLSRYGPLRLTPYVGAGAGTLRYKETSEAAEAGEDVDESFTSYHVLVGLDLSFNPRIAIGGEFRQRWAPDAIGDGGVSKEFNETDLGGRTVRLHIRLSF